MTDALPPPRTVANSTCTGEAHDQGAQVTAWAPVGAAPVLYSSSALVLARGHSIRAGIPLCWPWFGPGRGVGMEPMHGFVRTAVWDLVGQVDDDGSTTLTFRITSEEATSAQWPHPYATELRVTFGASLELALTTTNTGDTAFDVEEALHAYLAVGDVRRVSIEGLDRKSFFDKVTGTEREHAGALVLEGEIDAVFRTSDPVTVHDPVLGRRLAVSTSGAHNVVVWNPWEAKAAEVPDIGDDDWPHFVCIEAANALDSYVTVQPGESRTLTYHLEVQAG